MLSTWISERLTSEPKVFDKLTELGGKRWLCRGHSECQESLAPSIDRDWLKGRPRPEKLEFELRSIELFRETAKFFSHPGEQLAMVDEVVALMVLRHYGVPTRLLDCIAIALRGCVLRSLRQCRPGR